MQMGGPSDQGDEVNTHKLSHEKVYTERVDFSPTDILLSEILNKFIAPAFTFFK